MCVGDDDIKTEHHEISMNVLSKLRICNRSVESSHRNNNTKYMSVKVGITPRLKELSPSLSNIHVSQPLFNINKIYREPLQR